MDKFTIEQFRTQYPNDDACLHKIFQIRFTGLVCPMCESENSYSKTTNRRTYQCSQCSHQISPTAGTVFEKTTIPLTHWFYAIFLFTTTRNGVAAKELERQLNICYKTALRMTHQIRKLMTDKNTDPLDGIVEADECFIGGKAANKHKHVREQLIKRGTGYIHKTPVFGMLQRGGRLKIMVIPEAKGEILKPLIRKHINTGATLITDGFGGYANLKLEFHAHEILKHEKDEFVRTPFHTNNIECFWWHLKRTIKGTYIHVSNMHLQKYIDEVSFRYVHRHKPAQMFDLILRNAA